MTRREKALIAAMTEVVEEISSKVEQILLKMGGKTMGTTTDPAVLALQTQVAALQTEDAAVESGLAALASAVTNLNAQIATLQNQLAEEPNLDPQIQAQANLIETEVGNLTTALTTALAALPAAPAPAVAAAPAAATAPAKS